MNRAHFYFIVVTTGMIIIPAMLCVAIISPVIKWYICASSYIRVTAIQCNVPQDQRDEFVSMVWFFALCFFGLCLVIGFWIF